MHLKKNLPWSNAIRKIITEQVEPILILPHLGLGDQLIMNGYINYLFIEKKVPLIYLVSRTVYKYTIEHMYDYYVKQNKIKIICMDNGWQWGGPASEIHYLQPNQFGCVVSYNNIKFRIHSFGYLSSNLEFIQKYFWADSFYMQAGCDPIIRKSYFRFPSDLEISKRNYNLLVKKLQDSDYVIIVDDPSRRAKIDYSTVKAVMKRNGTSHLPVIYLGLNRYKYELMDGVNNVVLETNFKCDDDFIYADGKHPRIEFTNSNNDNIFIQNSLFDMYDIIKNCKEAHFKDTSLAILANNIPEKRGDFYMHGYVVDCGVELYHSGWTIIKKPLDELLITNTFWEQYPKHMCYNRLPLLANVIFDIPFSLSINGTVAQHNGGIEFSRLKGGDVVFVNTVRLSWFLHTYPIDVPIILITGVADMSPTDNENEIILNNPNVTKWIGCNILVTHPKIIKVLIGVGEPNRVNGNHEVLLKLHNNRIPMESKIDDVCVPYHGNTHSGRNNINPTIPHLEFEDYMNEITKHKFVLCNRGNGVDTHRFSEALLMGSVPVVEHSGLDDLYSQFPCIFNDDDRNNFVWDESKYQFFIDMFWLRPEFKDYLNITQ